MKQVNNKNGIKMFWEFSGDVNKVNILDSNGNYFEDQYYDDEEDFCAIIDMLEETTLEDMCNYFGFRLYNSQEAMLNDEIPFDEENDYFCCFEVNDKTFYVWCDNTY